MKLFSMVCLLFLTLSACQSKKETTEQENFVEVAKRYSLLKISRLSGPCQEDSTSNRCLNIRIEVPSFLEDTLGNIAGRLNAQIKKDIFSFFSPEATHTSYDSLAAELSSEHERILEDYPDYDHPWNLEILSDIIYEDTSFVSIATNIFSYTGGAHPNNSQIYASYDVQNGHRIRLKDLFKLGSEEELNRAAEIEFRMLKRIPPHIKLEEEGYRFENDRFELNENFAILNKSLIFYYNPYEIGAYALGPSELQLNFSDYAHLIKQGSYIDK